MSKYLVFDIKGMGSFSLWHSLCELQKERERSLGKSMTILWRPFASLFFILGKSLAALFGAVQWQAPPWMRWLSSSRQANPKGFWGSIASLVIFVGILGGGYYYYQTLPKPLLIKASITAPSVTENRDLLTPDRLYIDFEYDFNTVADEMAQPKGLPSVASIDLIGKNIDSGIKMVPSIAGQWHWDTDNRIVFEPKEDWPAGQQYSINLDPSIFVPEAKFEGYRYQFKTPEFAGELFDVSFYQDPTQKNIRRVISRFRFTHSVDEESFKKHLLLTMRPSNSTADINANEYEYTIKFDKHKREAYVHSEAISLPEKENYFHVALAEGVKTLQGGAETNVSLAGKVIIPDVYSFLKVDQSNFQIVRNQEGEPEQIISLILTDDIQVNKIKNKIKAYLLPKYYNVRQVTKAILAKAKPVKFEIVPNEKEFSKVYSLRTDLPESKYIYLSVEQGLTSVNDFKLSSRFDTILNVPSYPREAELISEGAMLSLSGDKTLGFKARGVDNLKISISKLLDNSLNHLISQTSGDLNQPSFNYEYYFSKENITSTQDKILPLQKIHPKKSNFASLNIKEYLKGKGLGIFFVEVMGWDLEKNIQTSDIDRRLIIVTDLGVIVKHSPQGEQHVFVQSIVSGQPISRANVSLLGKNGLPVYRGITDSSGHLVFASAKSFEGENKPTVYTVTHGKDMAFIPFDRYTRQIEYSKFDVGGSYQTTNTDNTLTAYLFSDRGIYRPGDIVHIGAVVKQKNFHVSEGAPIAIQITNPRRSSILYKKVTLPEKGFLEFDLKTELQFETGNYQASIYLLDQKGRHKYQIGYTDFKVEEFQPDTLKITTQLEAGIKVGWITLNDIKAKINLTNLFGSPAQNRKINASIQLTPTAFTFGRYKEFRFTDPTKVDDLGRSVITETFPTQKTDADGKATFDISLNKYDQGTYSLQFRAEGFEPGGGRSVTAKSMALVSPLSEIIGFKADGSLSFLKRDQERNIHFIAIDSNLEKISLEGLTLKYIYKKPVSSLIQQYDGTFKYQTVIKNKVVSEIDFSIGGKGKDYMLATDKPGTYELQLNNDNGQVLSSLTYNVVAEGNLSGGMEKNAELTLKLDKSDYKVGETIQMNISAPYLGSGLITIESDKLYTHKWFTTTANSSMQTIVIPEGIEGNAYVNVTFVRSAYSKEIFTSPLSYAVQSFNLDRSKREVNISLNSPELARPGKPMTIEYSTDRPSKIVLFAVDEGILQVAKYKTPKPLDHFLKKKALRVKTYQMLDLILPEYSVLREAAGIGGGASLSKEKMLGANLNPFSRTRDKPAVYWSGIVDADSEKRHVTFNVPDTFSGELRVMAVSVAEGAMGVNTDHTIVRGPFVLSPNVLTAVAPGDEFIATVGVANLIEGSGDNAKVNLRVEVSENLEVINSPTTSLVISEGDEGKASFRIKAKQGLGEGRLVFVAQHKNEDAKRTATLSIRSPVTYLTDFYSGYTQSGKESLPLTRHLYSALAVQKASASAQPLVLVNGLTSYLEHYPHGCTEQLVSQVFPWLSLATSSTFSEHISDVRQKFAKLITSLRGRQQSDGGFSVWPGSYHSDAYPSVYIMHFLIEAKEKDFAVPQDMYRRGRDYLREVARAQASSWYDIRVRANAIYLLTRDGEVTTNYLVDLESHLEKNHKKDWKSDLAAAYMAATYKLLKKEELADKLISYYELGLSNPREISDYHSGLAMDAQYIFLKSKHFPALFKKIKGEDVLKLTQPIFEGEYNTLSSSYTTMALSAYSQVAEEEYSKDKIRFTQRDKDGIEKALTLLSGKPLPEVSFDTNATSIKFDSTSPLFYLVSQAGFDSLLASEIIRDNLEVTRDYLNNKGEEITEIHQGSEVTVRLRIRSLANKTQTNVAVIDLLPGGFEVIRSSVPRESRYWKADYVDVREDRIVFYGSFGKQVTELTYRAKATAEGTFIIPSAFAESMYDRSVRARSLPGTFNVLADKN